MGADAVVGGTVLHCDMCASGTIGTSHTGGGEGLQHWVQAMRGGRCASHSAGVHRTKAGGVRWSCASSYPSQLMHEGSRTCVLGMNAPAVGLGKHGCLGRGRGPVLAPGTSCFFPRPVHACRHK